MLKGMKFVKEKLNIKEKVELSNGVKVTVKVFLVRVAATSLSGKKRK